MRNILSLFLFLLAGYVCAAEVPVNPLFSIGSVTDETTCVSSDGRFEMWMDMRSSNVPAGAEQFRDVFVPGGVMHTIDGKNANLRYRAECTGAIVSRGDNVNQRVLHEQVDITEFGSFNKMLKGATVRAVLRSDAYDFDLAVSVSGNCTPLTWTKAEFKCTRRANAAVETVPAPEVTSKTRVVCVNRDENLVSLGKITFFRKPRFKSFRWIDSRLLEKKTVQYSDQQVLETMKVEEEAIDLWGDVDVVVREVPKVWKVKATFTFASGNGNFEESLVCQAEGSNYNVKELQGFFK